LVFTLSESAMSVKSCVFVGGLLLIVMAGHAIFLEVVEFRWGQIFTAKDLFLLGSIVFLSGGTLSSLYLSQGYRHYPEKYAVLTVAQLYRYRNRSQPLGTSARPPAASGCHTDNSLHPKRLHTHREDCCRDTTLSYAVCLCQWVLS